MSVKSRTLFPKDEPENLGGAQTVSIDDPGQDLQALNGEHTRILIFYKNQQARNPLPLGGGAPKGWR